MDTRTPLSLKELTRRQATAHPGTVVAGEDVWDLLVVIVSWNIKDRLAECLRSLPTASEAVSTRVVVFDNASADGTCEMVKREFPDVELIAGPENLGFARANNLVLQRYAGLARATLLLNPDTVVPTGAFRKMLDFFESHPEAGIVGCKLVTPQGKLDWPCKRGYITPSVLFYKALGLDRLFPNSRHFGRYHLTYLDENETHEVDSVVGAFMMIRRECLEAAGLLDESYFMYGEDVDYCYHAKALGWKVFYVPAATVIHYKGQSTRKSSHLMIHHWYESSWILYRKRVAPSYSAATNALVWMGFQTMRAVSLVKNFLSPEKRVPSRR